MGDRGRVAPWRAAPPTPTGILVAYYAVRLGYAASRRGAVAQCLFNPVCMTLHGTLIRQAVRLDATLMQAKGTGFPPRRLPNRDFNGPTRAQRAKAPDGTIMPLQRP